MYSEWCTGKYVRDGKPLDLQQLLTQTWDMQFLCQVGDRWTLTHKPAEGHNHAHNIYKQGTNSLVWACMYVKTWCEQTQILLVLWIEMLKNHSDCVVRHSTQKWSLDTCVPRVLRNPLVCHVTLSTRSFLKFTMVGSSDFSTSCTHLLCFNFPCH